MREFILCYYEMLLNDARLDTYIDWIYILYYVTIPNVIFSVGTKSNKHIMIYLAILLSDIHIYLCMPSERHSIYTDQISNKSIWFRIEVRTLVLVYLLWTCIYFAEHLQKKHTSIYDLCYWLKH